MPKVYAITAENAEELRKAMKSKENHRYFAKLQSVALRGEGKNNVEIGEITGYHPSYVSNLVSIYNREGINGLCKDGRKGGNNRNMTNEEEKAFLAGFEEMAKNGELTTINEIANAYDETTGKQRESRSTIYYVIHKHKWRMITTQTVHPGKASDEEIASSKKLTMNSKK